MKMKIFQDFETPSETTDFVAGKIASIVATAQVRKAPGLHKVTETDAVGKGNFLHGL